MLWADRVAFMGRCSSCTIGCHPDPSQRTFLRTCPPNPRDLSLASPGCSIAIMSKTAADRRREDRERERAERQRRREEGVPEAHQVYSAVTEAVSYAILTMDRDAIQPGWTPINAALIIAVAVDILCERSNFDPAATKVAVRDALAPRGAHRTSGYLPYVARDGTSPRYKTKAPASVTRRQ